MWEPDDTYADDDNVYTFENAKPGFNYYVGYKQPNARHIQLPFKSRNEEDIERSSFACTSPDISIQNNKVGADIQAYIHGILHHSDEFQRWSARPDILDEIETTLMNKAYRVFRWIACQLDVLEKRLHLRALRIALASLPETLDETVDAPAVSPAGTPYFDPAERMPVPRAISRGYLLDPDEPWQPYPEPTRRKGKNLYYAAIVGLPRPLDLLLNNRAKIKEEGGVNGNVLHTVCIKGHADVVWVLLEKGADVNAKGDRYGHALSAACFREYEKIVGILLVPAQGVAHTIHSVLSTSLVGLAIV
ncbi:hypothetical protein BDW75DRAFT_239956 [Aspergillus navahoensis]